MIIVAPPGFDLLGRVVQRQKPVDIQAFIAETAVERLDVRIILRPSRTRKIQNHTVLVSPEIKNLADEFAAIVDLDPRRHPEVPADLGHHCDDPLARDVRVHVNGQAFPREHVQQGQRAEPFPIEKRV